MKVKEIIEALKSVDPESDVKSVGCCGFCYVAVKGVEIEKPGDIERPPSWRPDVIFEVQLWPDVSSAVAERTSRC